MRKIYRKPDGKFWSEVMAEVAQEVRKRGGDTSAREIGRLIAEISNRLREIPQAESRSGENSPDERHDQS